jgi:extradiol dioxygenase family protein
MTAPFFRKGQIRSYDEIFAALFAHDIAIKFHVPQPDDTEIGRVRVEMVVSVLGWVLQLDTCHALDLAAQKGQEQIDYVIAQVVPSPDPEAPAQDSSPTNTEENEVGERGRP